jgi:hypothetical protein
MSAVLERVDPRVALARLHADLDELLEADLSGLSDEELLAFGRETERLTRRLVTADHRFVAEVLDRDLPGANFVRPVSFLRGLFRIDPREAAARIAAAEAAAPRRSLTGDMLAPVFEQVAAAQAAGDISPRHASLIVATIEKLPDQAQAEHGEQVEADLVEFAGRFDPHQLAKIAARLRYCYDQDGALDEVEHRNKTRELIITQRPDGSSSIKGEATAELTELLLISIDALGKPLPETDGVKDPRTAGQRRHDALLDALKINLRARALPSIAGVTATIVLTMTAEDFEARTGPAHTAHGALIPVPEAMRITAGEFRLMNVVIDKTRGITAYSDTARLFTENQRLARAAIDKGCTFPDCPAPPGWCELDHIIAFCDGGPTRVDLANLACGPHHRAKQQGWRTVIIHGRVGWIPPRWIDPEQRPRFNHLHDTELPRPVEG